MGHVRPTGIRKVSYVQVDKDLNALINLGKVFPFILFHDDLKEYVKGFVNWHKQTTLEISVVVEGAVNVCILEQEVTMIAGDAFLIFPGTLHSVTQNPAYSAARYYTLIFEPELLIGQKGSLFDCEYYSPIIEKGYSFMKFSRDELWTKKVFEMLDWIYDNYPKDSPAFKLQLQRTVQDIWILFQNNLFVQKNISPKYPHTTKILKLINYIHEHYEEKFSLTDMSEEAHISRGECCRYFKQMMNMTISEYLLEYRISKAMSLLDASSLNITEIAEATGFGDTSYFIKKFRQKTTFSPLQYRAKHLE